MEQFRIGGMTCVNCEIKIEKALNDMEGISQAKVNYNKGTAQVTYNADVVLREDIITLIRELDYEVLPSDEASGKEVKRYFKGRKSSIKEDEINHTSTNSKEDKKTKESDSTKVLGTVVILFALYTIMRRTGITNYFNIFPEAKENMDYGMLFFIGLLTSVHCIAMCGGINLSQCIPKQEGKDQEKGSLSYLRPSILYNVGRVVSYTVIGGIVGAVGSVVSFSGSARGIVQIVAGVFMVIMGLNMLNLFPWLRKFNPRMPKIFGKKIQAQKRNNNSPLYIGLLNGLMPCGPLQAMQLYALSTGDPLKGALSMLLFSLGTVPLMFGLGALSTVLSKKFTNKVMTAGAVLVVILGFSMFNNGLSLSGIAAIAPTSSGTSGSNQAQIEDGYQIVNTELAPGGYEPITVQVGIPVKWTITAKEGTINGCNNRIIISEYNLEKKFSVGENVVEFTPTETGTFAYSCWMGMIRSTITVVDGDTYDASSNDTASNGSSNDSQDSSANGTSDDSQSASTNGDEISSESTPTPAGYVIPTDKVAIGEIKDGVQYVEIDMEDSRFTPALVILQSGVDTEWVINGNEFREGNETLLFPYYYAQLDMVQGENKLYLIPTEDFDFSSVDYSFYGYVKVVDDIENINLDQIKEEVKNYVTTIWDYSSQGLNGSGGASCH